MAPSPTSQHQAVLLNLGTILRNHLLAHPIGRVYVAPLDTYLSEINVYQPDLLFVSNRRRRIIKKHGIEGAPDLVIEILSKATAKHDLGAKRTIYARTGVQELWIVDPAKRTLALYRLAADPDKPAATFRRAQRFTSVVLPGLEIALADVFAR